MTFNAGDRWINHPLLGAFTGLRPLAAFVRFKMWDEMDEQFKNLPAGIDVTMCDDSPSIGTDAILTVQTDASGMANFAIPNLVPPSPDMFFVVDTASLPVFAHRSVFPPEWSTKGWRSCDGTEPGLKPSFNGSTFGTAQNPVEFEIGVTLFLNITVESTSEPGNTMNLLPHTKLHLEAGPTLGSISLDGEVDQFGIARFFSFGLKPGWDVTLTLTAKIDSPGTFPFLKGTFVDHWIDAADVILFPTPVPPTPIEYTLDATLTKLAAIDKTSYDKTAGLAPTPWTIALTLANAPEPCAAFTCLKNMTELNSLARCVAPNPDWDDYNDMHINIGFPNGGLSWPVGSMNLSPGVTKDRSVQIHEFSHQLMWKWGQYNHYTIAAAYCCGDAHVTHNLQYFINTEHALLEGWAAIFELLAYSNKVSATRNASGAQVTFDSYPSQVTYGSVNPFGASTTVVAPAQLTKNWGECVEGAFAAAMFNVFKNYVLPSGAAPSSGPIIPATLDGDLTKIPHLSWLTASNPSDSATLARFHNTFVEPAKALAGLTTRTTTIFLDKLRDLNPSDWNTIRPILQDHFVAFPQLESVSPNNIQGTPSNTSTGVLVHVLGRHFINDPATKLFIDAEQVPVIWQNPGDLSCLAPPRPAGTVADVRLESLDGDDILVGGLIYV